jgi:hypothetical protein
MSMTDVIEGTAEDGLDLAPDSLQSRLLAEIRSRQEAAWALVAHGRIVIDTSFKINEHVGQGGGAVGLAYLG